MLQDLCLADYDGFGACVQQANHKGAHRDANARIWPNAADTGEPYQPTAELAGGTRPSGQFAKFTDGDMHELLRQLYAAHTAQHNAWAIWQSVTGMTYGPVDKMHRPICDLLDTAADELDRRNQIG